MRHADSRPSGLAAAAYAVLIVAALHYAKGLFLPLSLAALLSLLLLPLVKGVERSGLGRIPSILVVALAAFLAVGAFGWITIRQVSELGKNLPEYKGRVIAKAGSLGYLGKGLKELQAALAEVENKVTAPAAERDVAPTPVVVVPSPSKPLDLIGRAVVSGIDPLGTTVFVLILSIFILIYHVDLMERLVHMVGDSRVNATTQTVTEAVRGVSRYLFLQTALNAGFGILVAIGLRALGLPHAFLLGMLAALFKFVPYVGTWAAALLPFLLSVAISDGWSRPVAILGGWLALESLSEHVVEPWVYGSQTGMSPLAVILSAFFWTWMWGGSGLLLATPLTVSLVVLGKHLPQFSFLQTLLGSEAPLEPNKVQLYRRLLALDQQEAVELVDRFQAEKPPHEVYDELLLPALCMAESDRQRGLLDEEREEAILENISALLQDLGEKFEETGKPEAEASTSLFVPRIVCLPAARPADRVAAAMVTHLLAGKDWRVDTVPESATVGGKVDFLAGEETHLVVISAVPPSSLIQVRYLYKRVRRLHPKVAIVIGLWNDPGDPESLRKRVAVGADAHVVTTLAEAVDQIRRIRASLIPSRAAPALLPRIPTAPDSSPSASPREREV